MAKSKKVKPEEVVEPTITEVESIVEQEPVPPSVTLDEVELVKEEVVIQEPLKEPEPVVQVEESSDEQKLLNFIDTRGISGDIRLNDFLKSLFPMPKFNEPPVWTQQNTSKYLKGLLDKMVREGKLVISDNAHLKLGQFYYHGDSPQTQHHTLNTVNIVAKK